MIKAQYKRLINISLVFITFLSFTAYADAQLANKNIQNVILFIGDGMQQEHEIAASRYLTGKDNDLIWHQFPYRTFVSTWNTTTYNRYAYNLKKPVFSYEKFEPKIGYDPSQGGNKPYPEVSEIDNDYFLHPLPENNEDKNPKAPATDSAAAATAIATGIKTESGNLSWLPDDQDGGAIKTIVEIIREKSDKSVGAITTVPFNHATPAAFLSHNIHRNNFYTGKNGFKGLGIADEIIKVTKPDVIIGGGHYKFSKNKYLNKKLYKEFLSSSDYMISERKKGRDGAKSLINAGNAAIYFDKKLFGLFGGKDGNFEPPQPQNHPKNPEIKRATIENPLLSEATLTALNVLSKDKDGFFLLVEQGDIDWANHANNYKAMIGCMWDLNEAVKAAINFVNIPGDNVDWDNTLLIVTSDHANSYMRLIDKHKLIKGYLPKQRKFFFNWSYPDKEIQYSLKDHTNELVNLYAMGNKSYLFKNYEGKWYPGTRIIDNTDIFKVMVKALGLN